MVSNTCMYLHCNSKRCKTEFIKYYKFPKNPNLRSTWVQYSGNPKLLSMTTRQMDSQVLCEKHFDTTSFYNNSSRLMSQALPIDANQPFMRDSGEETATTVQPQSKLLIIAIDKLLEDDENHKKQQAGRGKGILLNGLTATLDPPVNYKMGQVTKTYPSRKPVSRKPVVTLQTFKGKINGRFKDLEGVLCRHRIQTRMEKLIEERKQNKRRYLRRVIQQPPLVALPLGEVKRTYINPKKSEGATKRKIPELRSSRRECDEIKFEHVDVPIKTECDPYVYESRADADFMTSFGGNGGHLNASPACLDLPVTIVTIKQEMDDCIEEV